MKERLIIIGAGNVGGFISYNIEEFGDYDIVGFLDDDKRKHGQSLYGRKVLGGIDDIGRYIQGRPLSVVVGIASTNARSEVTDKLSSYPLLYPNFVSKNVWLSKEVKFGRGIILYPGTSINYESNIGDFAIINMNCAIGHNCTILHHFTLAPGVSLAGFSFIEEGVDLGIGSCTRQNVRIGKYSIIGGQSMILKDVPEHSKVVGVPGRFL